MEVDVRKVRPLQTLSHYSSQQFGIDLERLLIWIMFRGYQVELIGEESRVMPTKIEGHMMNDHL